MAMSNIREFSNEICERHGKVIISGLVVCLVDYFRSDIISGRISIEDSIPITPHLIDEKRLVAPVIIQDNFTGKGVLVYTMFKVNEKGYITKTVPEVITRKEARALLDF